MRGRFYRAFLYVKKDDVMAYSGSDTVIMIPMSKTSSTTKGEEPQTVVAPEKKPEVVIEEQSKDATKVIETDKAGQQPIPEVSADSVGIRTVMQLSQREKELMDLKEFNQIEDYIRWRYSSNILKGYGQNRDIPENLDCYLIVYERSSGKIIAHLHKVGNTFTNLDSGKIEPITSYQDKGIVWLQFK